MEVHINKQICKYIARLFSNLIIEPFIYKFVGLLDLLIVFHPLADEKHVGSGNEYKKKYAKS